LSARHAVRAEAPERAARQYSSFLYVSSSPSVATPLLSPASSRRLSEAAGVAFWPRESGQSGDCNSKGHVRRQRGALTRLREVALAGADHGGHADAVTLANCATPIVVSKRGNGDRYSGRARFTVVCGAPRLPLASCCHAGAEDGGIRGSPRAVAERPGLCAAAAA
jgi:hypothetical protein